MKAINTILAITLLVGLLAIPTFLWAHGRGWGGGMMGNWGRGAGYECPYDSDDASLTKEQQEKLSDLDRKLYEETKDIRNELLAKSSELEVLLSAANPDLSKARSIQKEISELRNTLDEKNITREIEARKIAPKIGSSTEGGYGHMGFGMGYGQHMDGESFGMGYGRHMSGRAYGMRQGKRYMGGDGYGPGGCAN